MHVYLCFCDYYCEVSRVSIELWYLAELMCNQSLLFCFSANVTTSSRSKSNLSWPLHVLRRFHETTAYTLYTGIYIL